MFYLGLKEIFMLLNNTRIKYQFVKIEPEIILPTDLKQCGNNKLDFLVMKINGLVRKLSSRFLTLQTGQQVQYLKK